MTPEAWTSKGTNAGLLWHRYLPAHDSKELNSAAPDSAAGVDFRELGRLANSWATRNGLTQPQGKKAARLKGAVKSLAAEWSGHGALDWFSRSATNCLAGSDLWSMVAARRTNAIGGAESLVTVKATAFRRLAVGLGLAAGFENSGVSFDWTYGIPVLPGASLKGLLRHYWVEEREADATSLDVRDALGVEGSDGCEGALAFFDGWPSATALEFGDLFEVDVVNPHHSDYYGDRESVAADTDEPVPNFFLTIRAGTSFEIPIGLTAIGRLVTPARQGELLRAAEKHLYLALAEWGIGSRTGSGYGLMRRMQ